MLFSDKLIWREGFVYKRPIGLIALRFIISFLATSNWPKWVEELFGSICPNLSQRSKLENDLYSNSTTFIFSDMICFTPKKLHNAIHLGSTSSLLNDIDYYDNGPTLTFPSLKMTFRIIQTNPSLDSWSISCCMQTKSYLTVLRKLPNSSIYPNLTFVCPFGPW